MREIQRYKPGIETEGYLARAIMDLADEGLYVIWPDHKEAVESAFEHGRQTGLQEARERVGALPTNAPPEAVLAALDSARKEGEA